MVRTKIVSDLHLEFLGTKHVPTFLDATIPPMPTDSKTILLCCGDIGTYDDYAGTYKMFFNHMSKRFKHVIVVPGNHSWYHSAFWGKEDTIWTNKKIPKNVHYLDNDHRGIDGVLFVGSCLWTDFNDSNPLALYHAAKGMSDYEVIKKRDYQVCATYGQIIESNRLQPEDTVIRFNESLQYIKLLLSMHRDKKCVVVTHHGPSRLCVHPRFNNDLLNSAFYSDLDQFILDNENIFMWAAGHTHESYDFEIGETRCICNPYGYHMECTNRNFNPNLIVEV